MLPSMIFWYPKLTALEASEAGLIWSKTSAPTSYSSIIPVSFRRTDKKGTFKYMFRCSSGFFKCAYFQPVVAMPLVQAVCSVLILQASVHAKLVTKGTNVMLPVDVTTLVQSVQHVIRLQVNVLATLDTLVQLVIPVPPTFLLNWVERAQVSITLWKYFLQ